MGALLGKNSRKSIKMPKKYSEKQIEIANLLNSIGKQELPPEVVEEVVSMVGDAERETPPAAAPEDNSEDLIKLKLLYEDDWKKRAILSAMLISKKLFY